MGKNHIAPETLALYGLLHLMCGIAYFILKRSMVPQHGKTQHSQKSRVQILKVNISCTLFNRYFLSISKRINFALIYIGIAFIWLVPDKRIEGRLKKKK